ncbi:MAG TPA: hypothetical protein VKS20_02890 [Candidatus Acidoferrales bacterium]|nr:hypothetical protein [Candidatus Acidoferrales bacterium]
MKIRSAMRPGLIALSIGLLLVALSSRPSADAAKRSKPIGIGMIPLLAAPEKYGGKVIQTWGFLSLGRIKNEDDFVWLHKEDVEASLLKDAFGLDLTDKQREKFKMFNGTYVVIEGTLHSKGPSTSDMESGRISNVTILYGWKPYVPPAPRK